MDPSQVTREESGAMRCRECGFEYDLAPDEIAARSASGLAAVRLEALGVPRAFRSLRPSPEVWSVNAYTAHLADAAEVITARVGAIAAEDRPPLPYHDQDTAVEQSRADQQPVEASMIRLGEGVAAFCTLIRTLAPGEWNRIGIHERAGEVSLYEIACDMPHELEHHAMDIRRVGERVQ